MHPGVHINGYVTLPDGSRELWVARRSRSKPTWPGKLDHIVAGGQPHGLRWAARLLKSHAKHLTVTAASWTTLLRAGSPTASGGLHKRLEQVAQCCKLDQVGGSVGCAG